MSRQNKVNVCQLTKFVHTADFFLLHPHFFFFFFFFYITIYYAFDDCYATCSYRYICGMNVKSEWRNYILKRNRSNAEYLKRMEKKGQLLNDTLQFYRYTLNFFPVATISLI